MKLTTNDIAGLLNILGFQYDEQDSFTLYTHIKTNQIILAYLDEQSHDITYLDMHHLEAVRATQLISFYLGHLQLPVISENITAINQDLPKPKLKEATTQNKTVFKYFQIRKAKQESDNIPDHLNGIVWWSGLLNSLIIPMFDKQKRIINLILVDHHGHHTLNSNSCYYKSPGKTNPSILADPSDIESTDEFFLLIKHFDEEICESTSQYDQLSLPAYPSLESLNLNFSLLVNRAFKAYDSIQLKGMDKTFQFSVTHKDVTKILTLADKLNNALRSLSSFKNEDSNKEIAQAFTNCYGIDYYRTNSSINFSIFLSRGNLINFNQACHICNLPTVKFH